LCAALRTALREREPSAALPDPRAFLDLVALGTVCDMVPLVDVNRVFVRHGLRLLAERKRPGIRAMLERANVPVSEHLDEGHLGFQLGPRLNAPGRLGTADPSLQLLRARSGAEAKALAAKVEMFNQRRRAHQDGIVEEAKALLDADPETPGRRGLVVASERWLAGIVGIAASGLVERFRRPTLVVSLDPELGEARGSARTHGDIDVRAALHACRHLLERYGGHKAAAGVSLDPANLPALVEAFDQAVAEQAPEVEPEIVDEHDGSVALERVDAHFLDDVRRLAPYGVGFPTPVFLCEEARVARTEVIAKRHLKLMVEQGGIAREAMLFGRAEAGVGKGDTVSFLFTPATKRGKQTPQLRLRDIWPS
jgi:single-stranded-DNA-specific exonuclease